MNKVELVGSTLFIKLQNANKIKNTRHSSPRLLQVWLSENYGGDEWVVSGDEWKTTHHPCLSLTVKWLRPLGDEWRVFLLLCACAFIRILKKKSQDVRQEGNKLLVIKRFRCLGLCLGFSLLPDIISRILTREKLQHGTLSQSTRHVKMCDTACLVLGCLFDSFNVPKSYNTGEK